MAINIAVEPTPKPIPDYFPRLMRGRNAVTLIVLMIERRGGSGRGTVIHGNTQYKAGMYDTDWALDNFEDFHGAITLSNET